MLLAPIMRDAIKMTEETDMPIMSQIDYLYSKIGDETKLGSFGIADMQRQYHPCVFDYNASENNVSAQDMMLPILLIFKVFGYDPNTHGDIFKIMDRGKA